MRKPVLGVLGGMGPLATATFMELVIEHTPAKRDQDQVPMIVWNDPQIPDRTAHLLDPSKPDPEPVLMEDARALERAGADYIVIPCNTSHAFLPKIQSSVQIPVLNMVRLCAEEALRRFGKGAKVAVLATDGTLRTGIYERYFEELGLGYVTPDEARQRKIMDFIYNGVKANREPDPDGLLEIAEAERACGAAGAIAGCTELSVIYRHLAQKPDWFLDPMDILAKVCVERFEKAAAS